MKVAWHLVVRLDANHRIGFGHAVRVAALLVLLLPRHRLTVVGTGEMLRHWFPEATCLELPEDEGSLFLQMLPSLAPDLVLVDQPHLDANFWRKLHSLNLAPVVAIDDEGGAVQADLVINGTVIDTYHHYPVLAVESTKLLGSRYALLRPDFMATPWRDPVDGPVLAVIGSGERARRWAFSLAEALTVPAPLMMVVGAGFPDPEALSAICAARGIGLLHGLSGTALAAALANARVALITGGMIVYEALAVGVPSVVFPQESNLLPEIAWFAARGSLVDMGYLDGEDPAQVATAVVALLDDPTRRRVMSMVQRSLVDGAGIVRVAAAINQLLVDILK